MVCKESKNADLLLYNQSNSLCIIIILGLFLANIDYSIVIIWKANFIQYKFEVKYKSGDKISPHFTSFEQLDALYQKLSRDITREE